MWSRQGGGHFRAALGGGGVVNFREKSSPRLTLSWPHLLHSRFCLFCLFHGDLLNSTVGRSRWRDDWMEKPYRRDFHEVVAPSLQWILAVRKKVTVHITDAEELFYVLGLSMPILSNSVKIALTITWLEFLDDTVITRNFATDFFAPFFASWGLPSAMECPCST